MADARGLFGVACEVAEGVVRGGHAGQRLECRAELVGRVEGVARGDAVLGLGHPVAVVVVGVGAAVGGQARARQDAVERVVGERLGARARKARHPGQRATFARDIAVPVVRLGQRARGDERQVRRALRPVIGERRTCPTTARPCCAAGHRRASPG